MAKKKEYLTLTPTEFREVVGILYHFLLGEEGKIDRTAIETTMRKIGISPLQPNEQIRGEVLAKHFFQLERERNDAEAPIRESERAKWVAERLKKIEENRGENYLGSSFGRIEGATIHGSPKPNADGEYYQGE